MEPRKKVFVTGHRGFVGGALINKYSETFEPVIFTGDLLDYRAVWNFLDLNKPDVILHLASVSLPKACEEDPSKAIDSNVKVPEILAEGVFRYSKRSRFIFASTSQVYEPDPNDPYKSLDETTELRPQSFYARTKLSAESILTSYFSNSDHELIILRFFNHTHHTQPPGTFLSTLYENLRSRIETGSTEPILVGNLNIKRDMGAIQDLIHAIQKVILSQKPNHQRFTSEIYNICTGKAFLLADIANALQEKLGTRITLELNPTFLRPGEPSCIVGSSEKFQKDFNWLPEIASANGLIEKFLARL